MLNLLEEGEERLLGSLEDGLLDGLGGEAPNTDCPATCVGQVRCSQAWILSTSETHGGVCQFPSPHYKLAKTVYCMNYKNSIKYEFTIDQLFL